MSYLFLKLLEVICPALVNFLSLRSILHMCDQLLTSSSAWRRENSQSARTKRTPDG
jgi:hypothetical protein